MKIYSVARLYGRGVIVACLVIAFLLVSVELPRTFANSGVPANSQDMVEAATFILRDILDIDLSKYPFKVRFTLDGEYMGLPEKDVVFALESGKESADFIFTFTNGSMRLLSAYATEGLLPLLSVESEFDVARSFLEKCRDRFGAMHYQSMISMLEGIRAKENVTTFSGNIKFMAACGKVRDLGDRFVDFVEYRWTYVVDGAEAPLKCVALHFEQGSFRYFVDMWNIYRIGCEKIQVSREKAVETAIEKVQNASFRVYAGNETWIEVKGFKVVGVNWTNLMFTNYPSGGGARGGDPLTLYPLWRVNIYFDRLYSGNIYGASVAIWDDTGELCEIQPLYIMGSMFDDGAISSEPSNSNAEVIQLVPITEEEHGTSLQQVPWLTVALIPLILGLGVLSVHRFKKRRLNSRFNGKVRKLIFGGIFFIFLIALQAVTPVAKAGTYCIAFYGSRWNMVADEITNAKFVIDNSEIWFGYAGYTCYDLYGSLTQKQTVLDHASAFEQYFDHVAMFHHGHGGMSTAYPNFHRDYFDDDGPEPLSNQIWDYEVGLKTWRSKHFFVILWACRQGDLIGGSNGPLGVYGMLYAWHNPVSSGDCFIG